MSAASRARFAEVVRDDRVDVAVACLLLGAEVDPGLDVDAGLVALDDLAASVRLTDRSPAAVAAALGEVLGGFHGEAVDYEDLRSSLLHEVLRRRRGLPILLSVVWCEVAARLDLPAVPLGKPGHVLVCLGEPEDEHVVVDPFSGGRVVPTSPDPVLAPVDLLLRVLSNVRALTERQPRALETTRTRLWATELSLLLPHHPLTLRRERGELMVRLGDFLGGAEALERYAEQVADLSEQEAEAGRREARLARARLN